MRKHPYNIAHVLPWSAVAGTEKATLRIAQAVEGDTFKNIAFSPHEPSPVTEMFADARIETASYAQVELSYLYPKAFLRASRKLAREFRRRQVDLVHFSDWQAAPYAALAAKLARLPVICHVRNRYDSITGRNRWFLRAVDKFVFVSEDTRRRFGLAVPAQRGTVIYDGLDIRTGNGDADAARSVRREFGIPETAKIVGMVARVAPQKDYATLAKAAARVVAAAPDVRFLIVGEFSTEGYKLDHYLEVQKMLAENGISDHFIFTDFRTDVARLLGAMDIFVLSTHFEGLPLVIIEAMAHAKPVVATAVDGIPEIVLHEKTGLLHDHQDDARLAAHLLALLQDPDRAAHLGLAGREFVKSHFSRERFSHCINQLYRQVLKIGHGSCTAEGVI